MSGEKPTILVVDDDEHIRSVLREVLGEDYALEEAGSGPEGVERAKTLKPDLIILDVDMPGFDGYEVVKRLDAAPETRDTPVVILTVTRFNKRSKEQFEEWTSVKAFLAKPFDVDEFKARIEAILAEKGG